MWIRERALAWHVSIVCHVCTSHSFVIPVDAVTPYHRIELRNASPWTAMSQRSGDIEPPLCSYGVVIESQARDTNPPAIT